jgi:exopolysaccharide biosynthesis polyprenyl glycosylphosphotransferase
VALPRATYERTMEIVHRCEDLSMAVSVVPPSYGRSLYSVSMQEIGGIPVMRERSAKTSFLYPLVKRIFDLIVSVCALIVLAPVIVLIALLVRMDSPGPIFFKQKRVGLNGKEFDFYKFRTMYVEANPYAYTPTKTEDPRITKFGRWLRRSSLDEIPQFFNVILGDMSVVGPRPEMPFIVKSYDETQQKRLHVKPGITGIWQISAVRGEPIHANIEYDLFYIEHRSLLLDVIILLKTFVGAIRGIGAV